MPAAPGSVLADSLMGLQEELRGTDGEDELQLKVTGEGLGPERRRVHDVGPPVMPTGIRAVVGELAVRVAWQAKMRLGPLTPLVQQRLAVHQGQRSLCVVGQQRGAEHPITGLPIPGGATKPHGAVGQVGDRSVL